MPCSVCSALHEVKPSRNKGAIFLSFSLIIVFAWTSKSFAFTSFLYLFLFHDFSGISWDSEQMYVADHCKPNTINGFRESVPVWKMHECYFRIRKNLKQHSIPTYNASNYNGEMKSNHFKKLLSVPYFL